MEEKKKRELIELIEEYGKMKSELARLELKRDLGQIRDIPYIKSREATKDYILSEIINIIKEI